MPKRDPASEAKRSELIVLFLLIEGARSGYEIRTCIRDWRIDEHLPVSPATIYRTLERLANLGFLSAATRQNGRFPVSTVYSITPKGKEYYRALIVKEAEFSRTVHSLTTFLSLASYLDFGERERLARIWQATARRRIKELDACISDTTPGPGHIYGKPFAEWILLDHERDALMADAKWLDKYISIVTRESRARATTTPS